MINLKDITIPHKYLNEQEDVYTYFRATWFPISRHVMRVNRFLMFRPEILNFCRGIPKSEENVDDRDRPLGRPMRGLYPDPIGQSELWIVTNPNTICSPMSWSHSHHMVTARPVSGRDFSLASASHPGILIGNPRQASYHVCYLVQFSSTPHQKSSDAGTVKT